MASPQSGIMGTISSAPRMAKVLCCVHFLGSLLNLIGFAAPYWGVSYDQGVETSLGLWQLCASFPFIGYTCGRILSSPAWFHAFQALMTLGFLASGGTFLCMLMFVVAQRFRKRSLALLMLLGSLGAAGMNLVGIILFASEFSIALVGTTTGSVYLSWAFYLSCVGTAFFIGSATISGVLMSKTSTYTAF